MKKPKKQQTKKLNPKMLGTGLANKAGKVLKTRKQTLGAQLKKMGGW